MIILEYCSHICDVIIAQETSQNSLITYLLTTYNLCQIGIFTKVSLLYLCYCSKIDGYISLAVYLDAIPGVSSFVLSRCIVVLFYSVMVDIQVIVLVWGFGEFWGLNLHCCKDHLSLPLMEPCSGIVLFPRDHGFGTRIPCIPGSSLQLPCVSVYTYCVLCRGVSDWDMYKGL